MSSDPRRRTWPPAELADDDDDDQPERTSPFRLIRYAAAGIVVALVLVGQVMFVLAARQHDVQSTTAATAGRHGTLTQRVRDIASAALGPGDRSVPRVGTVRLRPDPTTRHHYDASLVWSIDFDVSAGSVGNGAERDAFVVLRALYLARLPLTTISLTGTYPLTNKAGRVVETPVLRLALTHRVAAALGSDGWDSLGPGGFWPLIHKELVAPGFAPISSE